MLTRMLQGITDTCRMIDHSHNMGQYPDGLRGPMIVKDPNDPYAGKYDEEVIVTLSDWSVHPPVGYHHQKVILTTSQVPWPIY